MLLDFVFNLSIELTQHYSSTKKTRPQKLTRQEIVSAVYFYITISILMFELLKQKRKEKEHKTCYVKHHLSRMSHVILLLCESQLNWWMVVPPLVEHILGLWVMLFSQLSSTWNETRQETRINHSPKMKDILEKCPALCSAWWWVPMRFPFKSKTNETWTSCMDHLHPKMVSYNFLRNWHFHILFCPF